MDSIANKKSLSFDTLNSLMVASRVVLECNSFEESARIIFDEARKVIGAKAGYVALLSENGSENEVLFLEAGGSPCMVDTSLPMPIRGLRSECYYTGKAVYHNNFMKSKHVHFMPSGHVEMKNVMFSPLSIENKVVGIMGLANKSEDFTDLDTKFATAFGEIAAIALKNSYTLDKLRNSIIKLEKAANEVKELKSLLPICSFCKNIRDDEGYWHQVEEYITQKSDISFTHSLCPKCIKIHYKEFDDDE